MYFLNKDINETSYPSNIQTSPKARTIKRCQRQNSNLSNLVKGDNYYYLLDEGYY